MRNKKALQLSLERLLLTMRQVNNSLDVPRKKIPLAQIVRKKRFTPEERICSFNARIPQYLAGIKRGDADLVRAAFAIGVMQGIALTVSHLERTAKQDSLGGTITTKVF